MSQKHSIQAETIIILSILFAFYVAGDLMTSIWLISNHPQGIAAESNPIGTILYSQQGFVGLMLAKILVFIAISLMTIILEFHYKHERNVMIVSNLTILGLMALSLIVVTVNVMMIYTLSLLEGTYESTFLLQTYIVIFIVTISGLFLIPKFIPGTLGIVEVILALFVILGPLAISPGIYQFLLADNLVNFIVYLAINAGIIGMMIYGMNKLYKHIIPSTKINLK